MRNMQPEAVDDDRRVTMYYKKFRSLNLSALRLPMEKDNPKSVVRRNSCMYGPSIFKVGAIRFYNID